MAANRRTVAGVAVIGAGVLVIIGVVIAQVFASPEVGPLAVNPSMPSLSQVAPPPSTSEVTTLPPSPQPAEPPEQVIENVGEFMPESFDVVTSHGQLNPARVTIARDTISPRGGVDPPAQPAVVLGSLTSLPGADHGSLYLACHSQINPPLACNFLSQMTQADVDSGAQVVVYGRGVEARYQVGTLSTDIPKGQLGTRFIDGPPGTLVLLTCNLDLEKGLDTFYYRIVVATLVSLKKTGA